MTATNFYTTGGRLDPASAGPVEAMLSRLSQADDPRLLLFVHGGLVPEAVGEATANHLTGRFAPLSKEGWELGFPIWRSGIGETIRINRDALSREPRFTRIVMGIIEWVDRRLGPGMIDKAFVDTGTIEMALAAVDAPERLYAGAMEARLAMDGDELERARNIEGLSDQHLEATELAAMFMADPEFVALIESGMPMMDEAVRERASAARLLPVPHTASTSAAAAPAAWVVALIAARVGYRVLKRCLEDRDHGIGPTIVEEVIGAFYLTQAGAWAWDSMKDDARQHFDPGGAGTLILDGLSRIARAGKPVRLLTIGHSAGSLFSGQLAREAARAPDNLMVDHILLAPAIRLDEAAERFGTGRANGFRIFTMSDRLESANHLDGNMFGEFYHRSLLYLISGVLERRNGSRYVDAPLLGLERHLSPGYRPRRAERAALEKLEAMFGTLAAPLIYSPTPADAQPGRETRSAAHGGYWKDEKTIASIEWIARNGGAI